MDYLLRKEWNFSFKGARSYAHGTDIYDLALNEITKYFGAHPETIKVSFHKVLRRNAWFFLCEKPPQIDKKQVYAYVELMLKKRVYYSAILERSEEISSRIPYDEDEILRGVFLEKDSASLNIREDSSYIEQIVALTKCLHNCIYSDAKGKWFFSRIELFRATAPCEYAGSQLRINAEKRLGFRLTRNSIWLDDSPIGEIWFTLTV